MARTDEPKTAPEVRPLGVTVLPSFEAAPRLKSVAEPDPQLNEQSEHVASDAPPVAAPSAPPALAEAPHAAQPGAHLQAQDVRGARALLRRRPGRTQLVAVPDSAEVPAPPPLLAPVPNVLTPPSVAPAALAPITPEPAPAATPAVPTVDALQLELRRERERADAAEAANAALRRRLAQLDDELAQFRPRAIVPFEDNTD